jgi:hypothetical protein
MAYFDKMFSSPAMKKYAKKYVLIACFRMLFVTKCSEFITDLHDHLLQKVIPHKNFAFPRVNC